MNPSLFQSLTIPDLWQQEALHALREGRDVVVHAPTGAGKTYIFEMLYPNLRGQAVFTVPTRALANDKLAEWQKKGWDVGIATGDVAMRLDAKIVVATLETQKGGLLERRGPSLLVIDEYQMIGDPLRGVNYEVAIALAPLKTQLLLLSGSVANPQDVVDWLRRIGRDALLVSHAERPVPLEEVDLERLPDRAGANVREWWPRALCNALRADLGPVLLFAPRRKAAEDYARQIAAALPSDRPLALSLEQQQLAGQSLARLLQSRVAFHHSGLSYAQRAALIEPLAKAGELRVVVATMGLAAGINFSMRSVAIAGTSYVAGHFEREVQPDELLQMFGRAGRRGLDDAGYALVSPRPPRLHDARPRQLRRAQQIDWPTLIAVMRAAEHSGREPFAAAMEINERLFTLQKIHLGVEHSLATGPMPCGLCVDMERARFARRGVVEMLNSRGEWEPQPKQKIEIPLSKTWRFVDGESRRGDCAASWRPALSSGGTLKGVGVGNLCRLSASGEAVRYGRELVLGRRREGGTLALSPWLKRLLGKSLVSGPSIEAEVLARLPELGGGDVVSIFPRGEQLIARIGYENRLVEAWIDSHGWALLDPPERRALPFPCRSGGAMDASITGSETVELSPCPQLSWCLGTEITASPAHHWRQLGLIEADGRPTRRGVIFSFFQHGEGLAVAIGLEDAGYPIADLIFDLANLRAGPRFAGDDSPHGGRLAVLCQNAFQRADLPGYLEMGVPYGYGAGASEAIRSVAEHGIPKQKLLTESLRLGDIERAFIEWRSLLRHIAFAPDYPWERWLELKGATREAMA